MVPEGGASVKPDGPETALSASLAAGFSLQASSLSEEESRSRRRSWALRGCFAGGLGILPEPHARPAAVFLDEQHPRFLERRADGGKG